MYKLANSFFSCNTFFHCKLPMHLTVIVQASHQRRDYLIKDKRFISIFTIYVQILKKLSRLWFYVTCFPNVSSDTKPQIITLNISIYKAI